MQVCRCGCGWVLRKQHWAMSDELIHVLRTRSSEVFMLLYPVVLPFTRAVRRAEEEARRKTLIAKEAAMLVMLSTNVEKILVSQSANVHMPQPDTQQFLDKVKRTQTAAHRIAQAPLINDDIELKKVSAVTCS